MEATSGGTFLTGEANAQKPFYIYSVSYSNGAFILYATVPSSGVFYKTANSGGFAAPPSTANFYVTSTCSYVYEQYFTSSTGNVGSISNGHSESIC